MFNKLRKAIPERFKQRKYQLAIISSILLLLQQLDVIQLSSEEQVGLVEAVVTIIEVIFITIGVDKDWSQE